MWANSQFPTNLFTFTKANGKPHFLRSVMDIEKEEFALFSKM